ncbi:response regulator [Insolitispirillum peregrinum]|uniref:Response regulator receiver domain-containing protein n=1 Tax=Insolitispirillum peregrinum TaxID=80876 RepID=A0A1N7NM93_9PROT|nr:response regulator [Insolitispirillum peregrinum]SIS99513.1 Response regulator receiver domain-containing protein [Insolitispirillum peregrinum]
MALNRPIEILLVEDNPGDARLTFEALRHGTSTSNIHHVSDGEQALHYLRKTGPFVDSPTPDIVLLDLNLPRRNGREVLADMKSDPALRSIPVVALTTSSARDDVNACYALGANAYMVKPVEFDRFVEAIRSFEEFWLRTVTLPKT